MMVVSRLGVGLLALTLPEPHTNQPTRPRTATTARMVANAHPALLSLSL
jgi:hypothetical protein